MRQGAHRAKKSYPLSGLLELEPVVLVTTAWDGQANIMPMSWHTMMEFEPPTVGCVINNRNYTFDIVKKTKNCVINIPTVGLAKKVVACGNISGRDFDKFRAFGLTQVPASLVAAPLIGECYANLECRVMDARMVAKYNFFILEVLMAWIDPLMKTPRTIHHLGRGAFMVAGRKIKLPSRMK